MTLRAYLNSTPSLGPGVYVDPTALVIGDVTLGENVSVWPMTVIRGDVNRVRIGAGSNVQDGSVLHVSRPFPGQDAGWPLTVGDEVTIGHRVVIHGCTIGNRCLIGIGSIVLDGVTVEDEVMIGAGSVVTPGKELRSRGLYLGNPARRVRDLTAAEIERFPVIARHYVDLQRDYAAQLTPHAARA
jgi:carbonic anhydrase/acetyltransferase-like protein (isoleucine patch superfamily)